MGGGRRDPNEWVDVFQEVSQFVGVFSPLGLSVFSTLPGKNLEKIAEQIRSHSINALLIIGGFEVCYCLSVSSPVGFGGANGSPMLASHIPGLIGCSSGTRILIPNPVALECRIAG